MMRFFYKNTQRGNKPKIKKGLAKASRNKYEIEMESFRSENETNEIY